MSKNDPGRKMRAGGSSGSGRCTVRIDSTSAGPDETGAVLTGVTSPIACWKNALCAALASAGERTDVMVGWTGGGVNGRMTGEDMVNQR